MSRRVLLFSFCLLLAAAGVTYGAALLSRSLKTLPPAENYNATTNTVVNTNVTSNTNTTVTLPVEKNLAVPFTSQAPTANWDADHQEFCEEAASLMVGRYFSGREIANSADAEIGLQALKSWQVENLGFYFDTTAEETAMMLEDTYDVEVELKSDPTITDIKAALAQGKLVIAPTAGRELGNPNFTGLGPIYHNLVIRGYTKDGKFITNDPGTRKGEGYVYKQSVIMDALHDWVPSGERTIAANGTATGEPVILIISKP